MNNLPEEHKVQEEKRIFRKVSPPSQSLQNVVLVLEGSFFPISLQHLLILNAAKQYLTINRPDISYLGSFIIPSGIQNLSKKMRIKEDNLKVLDLHRLNMCNLFVQDYLDIEVYSYLFDSQRNKGINHATKRLGEELNNQFGLSSTKKNKQIQVIQVIGINKLDKTFISSKSSTVIVINDANRISETELEEQLRLIEELSKKKDSPSFILSQISTDSEKIASSSQIRQMCNEGLDYSSFVSVPIYKYHIENTITYPTSDLGCKSTSTYVLTTNLKDIIQEEVPIIQYSELEDIDKNQYQLGKGAQANVVKGKYKGKDVAVKIYTIEKENSLGIKCFQREVRALNRLEHPNIIKLFGISIHLNYLLIILELVDNQNLLDYISNHLTKWKINPFWLELILALSELCNGLDYLAKKGFLHRDILAKNILIQPIKNSEGSRTFALKICDFGLSAIEQDKSTIVRGCTRHYAPESMLNKSNYTTSSDIYMFGNVLWEIVHRKNIFSDLPLGEVFEKVTKGQRELIDLRCPEEIKMIICSCWNEDQTLRPLFSDISVDLQRYYDKLSLSVAEQEIQ